MEKVVVLLPEGKLFDKIFADGIAPAIPGALRITPDFSSESTLGSVCNAIEGAGLVIADLSSRNPNIMYQVGFAHGIGKRVLLLAQHLENFPFDRARHPVIGYGADFQFLSAELSGYLQCGTVSTESRSSEPTDARARFLSIFGEILRRHDCEHRGAIQMENPNTFILLDQDLDLAVVQDLARKARELGLRLKLM